jgi:hypothetical protein
MPNVLLPPLRHRTLGAPDRSRSLARTAGYALAAAVLIGCGGAGSAVPPMRAASQQGAAKTVGVQFTIALPGAGGAASAARRRIRYVSASTKSATVAVTPAGGTASAPAVITCTPAACSGTVQAPVGSDTFAVKLFDATNGTGNLLSTGTLVQTIVLDAANHVNVTFDGVVHALALVLSPSAVTAGTPSTVDVAVDALDADGNTIVGPGTYVDANGNPLTISLADSDTSGATHLSTMNLTAPPATPVTLSYNGAAIPCITISANATAIPAAHAILPAAGPPTLYVAGTPAGSSTATVVRAISNPATSPSVARTISGASTDLNAGINGLGTDACANLLATTASQTAALQLLVFSATANGNVAPMRTFGDPNNQDPGPVTVDAAGDVTTAYIGSFYNDFQSAAIESFSPTASGAVAPTRTVTAFGNPAGGVVYDPSGAIWASQAAGNAIYVIPPGATKLSIEPTLVGNVGDEIDVDGGQQPQTTVDAAGNIYFTSSVATLIFNTSSNTYVTMWTLQFGPQSNGYPAPIRSIISAADGNTPPNQEVYALGTDATGNLYILGPGSGTPGNAIYQYAAPPSTSATPVATYHPSPSPDLIAVAPDGTIYGAALDLDTGFNEIARFAPTNRSTAASTLNLQTSDFIWFLGVAADGTLYVGLTSNGATNVYRVAVYAPGASGNAAPVRTITLPSYASYSVQGALDPAGDLYAVYLTYDAQTGVPNPSTVQVVPAGSTAPTRSFTVPIYVATGPAYDAARSALVLGNSGDFGTAVNYQPYQEEPNELQEFSVTSTGMATPIAQIRSGAPDGIPYDLIAIGRDAAGHIYAENGDGSVRVYDPATKTLVRSILGLPVVGAMAVDVDGTVYIAGGIAPSQANIDARRRGAKSVLRPRDVTPADVGTILVYGPSASGIVAPTSVIPASTVGVAPVALTIAH